MVEITKMGVKRVKIYTGACGCGTEIKCNFGDTTWDSTEQYECCRCVKCPICGANIPVVDQWESSEIDNQKHERLDG